MQGQGGPGRSGSARSLADEDIVRLILDGTVIRTRLDRKATNISTLGVIGVHRDGQKVLLSINNMSGESTATWRRSGGFRGGTAGTGYPHVDDLDKRGLKRPEFVIVDGALALEAALVALWGRICRSSVARFTNTAISWPIHRSTSKTS